MRLRISAYSVAQGWLRESSRAKVRQRPWICQQCRKSSSGPSTTIENRQYPVDEWTNAPSAILDAVPRRLHIQPNHPLTITRKLIESRFPKFKYHNGLFPVVSVQQNFDSLEFPPDHPGRAKSDTYYLNKDTVLRTHTSAHQVDTFRANLSDGYLIAADVYRRDAVDRSHYPVFHQMEGARTWDRSTLPPGTTLESQIRAAIAEIPPHDVPVVDPNPTIHAENPLQAEFHTEAEIEAMATHLKRSLEDVVVAIFSTARAAALRSPDSAIASAAASAPPLQIRWVDAYFPFTSPSWELEIFWQGDWLEVLGCGIVKQTILNNSGVSSRCGWAFGLGLERIAMLLFEIPDIRLFWSRDRRFLEQFDESKDMRRFVPFSKYPECAKDVAFWLPKGQREAVEETRKPTATSSASAAGGAEAAGADSSAGTSASASSEPFHENDLMEVVRNEAGSLVEDVRLIDAFTHPKTGRQSKCYRIVYRSLERTLTNAEVNDLHARVTKSLVGKLGVEIR